MRSSVPTVEIFRARIALASGDTATAELPSARPEAADEPISVIGADILITGNIEANVDLKIEGRVKGDVRCQTLILGERSSILGSVYAQRVRVSGMIEGAIETVDLAVEAGAHVQGDVTYARVRVANGGIVAGQMLHRPIDGDADSGAPS